MTADAILDSRTSALRAALAKSAADALLITQIDNVRWSTGFTGSSGACIVTQDKALFCTDSRYTEQAAVECGRHEVVKLKSSSPEELVGVVTGLGAKTIAFESAHLSHRIHGLYVEKLATNQTFVPTNRVVDDLRLVKDETEVAAISAACKVADRAYAHIVPYLGVGAVERDVMLELEWFIRKGCGAEVAFDTIVASGPRAALPHGRAAGRVMQPGDFVTLDFGARVGGYNSDITRTVVIGEATERHRKVYDAVHSAMMSAIEAMRPGTTGVAVDALAREKIHAAGFEEHCFEHGLGHSLGLAVHDGPGLAVKSDITLAPGMVITVEPGIYIPGWGGCRLEHDVLVTEGAPRILSSAPTELLEL